jgi:hypothetical protein
VVPPGNNIPFIAANFCTSSATATTFREEVNVHLSPHNNNPKHTHFAYLKSSNGQNGKN